MKKYLLALFLIFSTYLSFAQNQLQVQSNEKGLYIMHTVSPKENFYSIGRLYSISPKDIAAFNSVDMSKGLSIGQTVMIPLNSSNFSQTTEKGLPVYYKVGDKEGLLKISQKHNNVLLSNLREWNNLKSDVVSTGQKLIVGYVNATGQPQATVAKSEAPKQEPVVSKPAPPTTEAKSDVAEKKPEPIVEKKQDVITEPKKPQQNTSSATTNQQVAVSGAGYFKGQFDQQSKKIGTNKDLTVTSSIFKTTSGWQDAKYYALMDNVEPGTIIRVSNPDNNKAIFAKVLGEMSGIRQNQGLEVRISNAAASALNVSDTDKFIVKVNY